MTKPRRRKIGKVVATGESSRKSRRTRQPRPGWLPVVGVGASAGGLEAIEAFLQHVPPSSGLAFVIVQHLDPSHKGLMVELLQRTTAMPVAEVRDRMKVEGDHVYLIPPDRDLTILHGSLHLMKPVGPRGLRLPIDVFFRSLAEDQKERSIGVVLSGMGTDGTLGLRAIKEQAGVGFVQEPTSAKFDGMPRSAIAAGVADAIAPVEELPAKILGYLQHVPKVVRPEPAAEDHPGVMEKIFILLRHHTGHDFSQYKRSTLARRIERRMALHQIGELDSYVRYLQENPVEARVLFKELLIGVTSFFRDEAVWDELGKAVLPPMLADRPAGAPLRAWVPACSTGEEAYSLAMVVREALELAKPAVDVAVQVFATDLDKDAIDQARLGEYQNHIVGDVSPQRLRRFFVQVETGYRVAREIRETVVFAPHDLIMDPPFTRLDIISCRNLFIYLTPELQKKLLALFHFALAPGGILVLGTAETPSGTPELFAPIGAKMRLFRRIDSVDRTDFFDIPAFLSAPGRQVSPARPGTRSGTTVAGMADQLLLERHLHPTVLTTEKGEILYLRGRTGAVLEPVTGGVDWNIFAMARGSLRYELSSAFRKALREDKPVTLRGVQIDPAGADGLIFDVTVEPINAPEGLRGTVLTVFTEPPAAQPAASPSGSARSKASSTEAAAVGRMKREIRASREEMQRSREEMQISQEELQSTNEELQSTNEELTTSQEEMQSMNEELQTLNQELQAKVDDLSRADNDMKNLLDSTDIATLFLDASLKVRRFTAQTSRLFKLIPGDVGRPISDLAVALIYPTMADDAREVLRRLVPMERAIATEDGRWLAARVLPYRTLEDKIDGVVITFADITVAKKLEASLREAQAALEKRLEKRTAELKQSRLRPRKVDRGDDEPAR
jgi:two-component system, chemotaxis family, CheB/CheR fusion protein